MRFTASAAHALPVRAPAVATVIGGDAAVRRDMMKLLGDAGFTAGAVPAPGALVVVLGQGREDARLREIRMVAEAQPAAPILAVVPGGLPNAALRRVLLAGATGIVLGDDVERALVPTARAVLAGQLTVPPVLVRQIAPRPLSHREKQILALVVQGRTNREIARKLFLAESTVKTHLSSAFRKLDARSRAEAVTRLMNPENGYGAGALEIGSDRLVAAG